MTVHVACSILALVAEAEPEALQSLEKVATVIQKHWRGLKVGVFTCVSPMHVHSAEGRDIEHIKALQCISATQHTCCDLQYCAGAIWEPFPMQLSTFEHCWL